MKQKIKFGIIDVVLCVLLVALIGVNIYAYSGDIAAALPKGDTGKTADTGMPDDKGKPDDMAETYEPEDSEPVALEASEVTADVVAGNRRMNLFYCNDNNFDTWYLLYELDITLTEITRDVYRIDITTAGAEYSDGSTDGIEAIEGTATGTVEDGILRFIMPGLEGAPLHLTYLRFGDEIAAVAYESDRLTTAYYAVEMFLPE